MLSFRCFLFIFKIFAKCGVIKVVSEPESTVVFVPCMIVAVITSKNVFNLSDFVKSCLFVKLILP